MEPNDRHTWAVDMLTISASDAILEIGCGAGIAVELIAQKLSSGTITAIDQSPAMIQKASKRNSHYILAGKVNLLTGKLAEVNLPDQWYDKVFAFNVSLFWKNPVPALQIIRSHLKPGGTLYVFHQPPHDVTRQVAEKASEQLTKNSFSIVQTVFKDFQPVSAFCIMAKPDK